MNFSSIVLTIILMVVGIILPTKVAAQVSGPGLDMQEIVTLSNGRIMVAKVTKITAPPFEGDELAFELWPRDRPEQLVEALLYATSLPGFDSYAELHKSFKTGVLTIKITRTRPMESPIRRQLYHERRVPKVGPLT